MTSRRWWSPWTGPQGIAALVLLVGAAIWRAVLLHDSFFNQDDFYATGRAFAADLDLSFLFSAGAGHVNPLQQLNFWVFSRVAPYDWGVVATFILSLQVAASVMMWLVLSRLLPRRWVRLPLLAVLAVSPLTLAPTLWWAAAICLWPHLLCSLLAVWFLLRKLQGDGARWVNVMGILLVTVVGLAWYERSVLIPPLLFAVAVAYPTGVTGFRRLVAAVRDSWVLWLLLVLLAAGFLVAHLLMTAVPGGSRSYRVLGSLSARFVFESVIPGLAGGPWRGGVEGGAVHPATWVTAVSLFLAVVAVLALLRWGGEAKRWALVALVCYVLADIGLLVSGRSGFGSIIALDPRYSSDVVQVLPIVVALALRGRQHRTWPRPLRRRGALISLALTVAYVGGAAAGSAVLVPHFQNTEDRAFVGRLRAELAADPTQVMVDRLAPTDVVLPLVGEGSLLSRILAPLPEHPAFDEPSTRLRRVTDDGALIPVELDGSVPAVPGPDAACGYGVRAGRTPVRFPVELQGPILLRVGFFTGEETTVSIRVGAWRTHFLAGRGLGVMWVPVPAVGRPFSQVVLDDSGNTTVCVTSVDAGRAESE